MLNFLLKKIDSHDFNISSKLFLLHKEERTSVIKPLAIESNEGTGSMGDDTALAVMSKMHRQIYDYFRQQFAQVTNPPIDSLRESSVMSTHISQKVDAIQFFYFDRALFNYASIDGNIVLRVELKFFES